MAFIADSIAAICNISRQWKIFGDYWHLNNMRQLLDVKNRRGSKADKEDVIISIFKKVAEATATSVIQPLIAAGRKATKINNPIVSDSLQVRYRFHRTSYGHIRNFSSSALYCSIKCRGLL